MKRIILFQLFISALLGGLQQAMGFDFNEASCSVEQTDSLTFKINENEFTSNVRVAFNFEPTVVPSFKIQFFSHKPKKVFLQWKEIDGLGNRATFNPYLNNILQLLQSELIELHTSSGVDNSMVFETKDVDVRQLQGMVALFLSQRTANVVVENTSGDMWSANVSLRGTTSAYKKLTTTCMADKSAEYLPEDAISTGYGLLNYVQQLSELQGIDESLPITVQSYNSALQLLQQKDVLIGQFEAVQSDALLKAVNLFKDYSSQQQEIQNRIQAISGGIEQKDGLIPQLNQQLAELQTKLSETKNSILLETQNTATVSAEIDTINQSLAPFLPKINEFSEREQVLQEQTNKVLALIEHLTEMLNEKKLLVQPNGTVPQNSPPWNLQTIEQKNAEIVTRTQEYNRMSQQIDSLKRLHDSSKMLVQAARQQDTAMTEYLGFVSEKTKTETELQGIERAIRQYNEIPYYADLDDVSFIILNTRIEDAISTASDRTFETEFSYHQSKFKQLSDELNAFKKRNIESRNLIFMNLVCDPSIIINPQLETSPCINPNELLNTALRNQLLNSLPPATIDSLLNRVPQPWDETKSKTEILAERLTEEMSSSDPELEAMLQNWTLLRLIVWRWSSQQRTSDEFASCNNPALNNIDGNTRYNSDFYINVFTCEKQQLNNLEVQKANQQTRRQELSAKIEASQAGFRSSESEFNLLVQTFREQVSQMQTSTEASPFFEAMYAQCLIPSINPSQCENSFQQIFSAKTQFEEAVLHLQSQILQMLEQQNNENTKLTEELSALQQAAAEYASQNNINDLLTNKAAALQKITDIETTIKNYNDLIAQSERTLLDLQKQKDELLAEESLLMARASLLSLKSIELKSVVADTCPQILTLNNQITQIDEQIRNTLNATTPSEQSPASPESPFAQLCQ